MEFDEMDNLLNEIAEEVSNYKTRILVPLAGTDRTAIYDSIETFLQEHTNEIGIRRDHALQDSKNKDRYLQYRFIGKSGLIIVNESPDRALVILASRDEAFVKSIAGRLVHTIQETLGYELSIEER